MSDAYTFQDYLANSRRLLEGLAGEPVQAACDVLEAVYKRGGTVFACGNGGSAATASHFIEDLAKLMLDEKAGKRLKCSALTEATPFLTALANDDGYERIFDIQMAVQASPGDALICISGSGKSPNVVRAAKWAKAHDVKTISVTGYDGGELQRLCNVNLHVPSHNMGMLEGIHMLALDFLSKELRYRVYGTPHVDR